MLNKIHRVYALALAMALFTFAGDSIAADWTRITPDTGAKTSVKVKKKTFSYWELKLNAPVKVKVEGPTILKVYTRALVPDKRSEVLYGVSITRDNDKKYYIGRGSVQDKNTSIVTQKGSVLSKGRNIYLKVPAGAHEFVLTLPKESKNRIFTRFYVKNDKKKEVNYIPFLPRTFPQEVKLVVKEQEYIYYRSSSEKPVELEVIGPTRIRAVCRLEFDHTMRGEKPFRVQVRENNKALKTQALTGKVSGTATYRETSTKVAARGENFYIDVPEGRHRLEVLTPDPNVTVLFRFYIPQKDLSNGLTKKQFGSRGFFNLIKSDKAS